MRPNTGTINIDGVLYYDPRGKIVWYDLMEKGTAYTVHWAAVTTSTGTTAYGTDRAFNGAQSLKLTTKAAGADSQGASMRLGLCKSYKVLGFSFHWMTPEKLADFQDIYLQVDYYDGAENKTAKIKHRGTDTTARNDWQYWTSAGAYDGIDTATNVDSASQKLVNEQEIWHWCKLVVDFDNEEYVRLYSDTEQYNLSGLAIQVQADTSTIPQILVQVVTSAETATAVDAYIDNFIITSMEDH